MKNKLASIVLVTVLISAGLFILSGCALVEAGASTVKAPEEEYWNIC